MHSLPLADKTEFMTFLFPNCKVSYQVMKEKKKQNFSLHMYPIQMESKTFIIIVITIYYTCSEKRWLCFVKLMYVSSLTNNKKKITETFVSCRLDNVWNIKIFSMSIYLECFI